MSDKPTYKEFNRRSGDTVIVADGRSFIVENNGILRGIIAVYPILFYIAIFIFNQTDFGELHRNFVFDAGAIMIILYWPLMRLLYKLARFRVNTEEDDYNCRLGFDGMQRNRKPMTSAVTCRVSVAFFAIVLLFCIANSFFVFYIRSAIEDRAHFTTVTLSDDGEEINLLCIDSSDGDEVTLPADTTPLLFVETACTTEKLTITLDGKSSSFYIYEDAYASWFWETDYFIYRYRALIDEIHDGSVLEMTCGDLYQQWVFDLPEA